MTTNPTQPRKPLIAAIIPAFKEERNIAVVLDVLHRTEVIDEISLVEEGPPHSTTAIMEEHARSDLRMRVIRHETNKGKGPAIFTGWAASRGAGLQSISKLTADGRGAAHQWVSGLNNPTGLAVRKNLLYAVERPGLAVIDIPSAKVVSRIAVPGAAFLNDIALAENGDLFVSDSRRGSIFKISDEKAEEWLTAPAIAAANGVFVLKGKLIIGTNGDGCLKAVDLETKTVSTLVNLGQGIIDGIAADADGNLLVSHNEGRLFRVSAEGRVETIFDTTAVRLNIADFFYDPGRKIIVFPTFTESRVAAFRLVR